MASSDLRCLLLQASSLEVAAQHRVKANGDDAWADESKTCSGPSLSEKTADSEPESEKEASQAEPPDAGRLPFPTKLFSQEQSEEALIPGRPEPEPAPAPTHFLSGPPGLWVSACPKTLACPRSSSGGWREALRAQGTSILDSAAPLPAAPQQLQHHKLQPYQRQLQYQKQQQQYQKQQQQYQKQQQQQYQHQQQQYQHQQQQYQKQQQQKQEMLLILQQKMIEQQLGSQEKKQHEPKEVMDKNKTVVAPMKVDIRHHLCLDYTSGTARHPAHHPLRLPAKKQLNFAEELGLDPLMVLKLKASAPCKKLASAWLLGAEPLFEGFEVSL
ncbi:unnamed protein product [Polarella glacialis]|uniref:Uncharacterized protein n=1 Tax=Polarella glacialis TaxID=89957 RepID=A0A813IBE5_POLGL|nr:unnamed protein product [Polarella glacialis]